MRRWAVAALLLAAPASAAAAPLFASDAPLRIAIEGPVGTVVRNAARSTSPQPATLKLSASAESLPIRLSARGLSRRTAGICQFPPLRVEFTQPPGAASLFRGQRRLKLVTHCRSSASFQQHLLLEYSAYRIFNLLTPLSYRVRLAAIDYVEPGGKVIAGRWGFFIEDTDDLAKRNGLSESRAPSLIPSSQLDPAQAGRVALFQYMIGNLDWSIRAGPADEGCCHNSRLLAARAGGGLVPVPYDFDYSGLVDAPYSVPPDGIPVQSVRQRYYRGYCRHNPHALAAAAQMRARRADIEAVYATMPGLEARTRSKALGYLSNFFAAIATDQSVAGKILKDCIG